MDDLCITYRFEFESGETFVQKVNIGSGEVEVASGENQRSELPAWTQLEYLKCEHCPLDESEVPHCPVAEKLYHLVEEFKAYKSFTKVNIYVETKQRTYFKAKDLQSGLLSLFGLIMASCSCPYLKFFKPLTQFHLPFASQNETMFRTLAMQVLRFYFKGNGNIIDMQMVLDDLHQKYEEIEKVNSGIFKRIKTVIQADAELNVLVGLSLFAQFFQMEYEDDFAGLAELFE